MKYIARVPASKLGYVLIETLKEHLNTEDYRMVTRFTGKRTTGFGGHTRKEDADSIRIYIEPRSESSSPLYGDVTPLKDLSNWELQTRLDEQERRLADQASYIDQLVVDGLMDTMPTQLQKGGAVRYVMTAWL